MSLTKENVVEKIEVVNTWNIQICLDTVIKENSVEISRSRHRHVLTPFSSSKDSDDKWTHTDTDISAEDDTVKAVCNAVWSDTIKNNYKQFIETQEI